MPTNFSIWMKARDTDVASGYQISCYVKDVPFRTNFRILHTMSAEKIRLNSPDAPGLDAAEILAGPDLSSHGLADFKSEIGFSRTVFDLYISFVCARRRTSMHTFLQLFYWQLA